MKNRKFINSWNRIEPNDFADSRMLSAILAENRRIREKNGNFTPISRKVLCGILIVSLILAGAISAGAIPLKKPFFPTGLPVLRDRETASTAHEGMKTAETSAKSELFHKMLNAIDYYDTAKVSLDLLEPHMTEAKAVSAEVDLLTGESYESIAPVSSKDRTDGILPEMELYADAEQVTTYDHVEKRYFHHPSFARRSEEEELGKDAVRIYVNQQDEDSGTPTYIYRQDATNTVWSGSYCLFPQNLAFGYLTDFSLWEITGTSEYLGRSCIEIAGVTTASYAMKIGAETFTMCVDEQTGILLNYEAKDENGATTGYVNVKEISVDIPLAGSIYGPSQEKYADYELK